MPRHAPSEDALVVRPAGDVARVRTELAAFGEVEDVEASGPPLLRVDTAGGAARNARDRILDQVSAVAWAEPLLVDEQGGEHLPTGEVSVRFHEAPSDEDLATFGERHGLEVRRRNEFVPEQASFAPVDPREAYLPDLVDTVREDPEVSEAWANTLSRYRRVADGSSKPARGASTSTS